MKRWPLAGVIVLFVLLGSGSFGPVQAQVGTLSLGPPVATAEGVTVEVLLAPGTSPVSDLQFDITADSTAARLVAVTAGPAAGSRQLYSLARADGRCRVVLAGLDTVALVPGGVARLLLQPRNAAAAVSVTLDSAVAADPAGNAVLLAGCRAEISLQGAQARLLVGQAVIAGADSVALPVGLDAQGVALAGLVVSLRYDAGQLRYLRVRSAQITNSSLVTLSASAPAAGRVDLRLVAAQGVLPSGTLLLVELATVAGATGGVVPVVVDSVRALTGGAVPVQVQAGAVYVRVPAVTTWALTMDSVSATPGRVEVPVQLTGAGPDLADLQFEVSYPAADLELQAAVAGPASTPLGCVPQLRVQAAGRARIVLPNLTRGTFCPGQLLRLVFALSGSQGNGVRSLELLAPIAGDLAGRRVEVTPGLGAITVTGAQAQSLAELWVEPGPLAVGASAELGLVFHSADQSVCDLQFDLLHPAWVAVQGVRLAVLPASADHEAYYQALGPGATRVVVTAMNGATLPDGRLLALRLATVRGVAADSAALATTAIVASDPLGQAVLVAGRGTHLALATAPRAWSPSAALNLGTARLGGAGTSGRLWLHNPGTAPLVVRGLSLSSGAFATSAARDTVAAGDSLLVSVSFRPRRAGAAQDDLVIQSNATDNVSLSISLTGWATGPQLDLAPDSLDFGRCPISRVIARRCVLRSSGTDTLRLSAATVEPGAFAMSVGPLPIRLAPGDSLVVTVAFSPVAPGDFAGGLRLVSDDPVRPQIEVPLRGQSFDPAVEGDVEYQLDTGWSLLGTPLSADDPARLFPAALSLFAYDADRGYHPETQMRPGLGYWVNLPSPRTVVSHGPWAPVAWPLRSGWSLVSPGRDTVDMAAVRDQYPALSAVFAFDGTYLVPQRLEPGRGYWLHLDWPAVLNPGCCGPAVRPVVAADLPNTSPLGGASGFVWVKSGPHQVCLRLGARPSAAPGLPPPPPPGALDARVRVGDRDTWEVPDGDEAAEFVLRLQGPALALTWHAAAGEAADALARWELVLADRVVSLTPQGTITEVTPPGGAEPTTAIFRRLPRRPETTRLAPNYPNPFNPATTLRYDLAHPGPVSLRVYTVTGQLVRELVAAQQAAGSYTVAWDGRDRAGTRVASGLYLAVLQAGPFRAVNRMVLIE